MKRDIAIILSFVILSFIGVSAQTPKTLSVQGILTDISGNSLPDGSYDLTFRLYHTTDDEAIQWQEDMEDVAIGGGLFNVILGKSRSLDIPFDRQYYLGISVDSGPEMTPRIELTSTPYTMMAMSVAANAVTSSSIEDNSITTEKIESNIVSGINGVTNDGGEITLEAGENIAITPNPEDNSITISAIGNAAGDINAVNAGEGLSGGGTIGEVTLSLDQERTDDIYVNENQNDAITSEMIKDDAITTDKMAVNVISSINNVTNDGGNINLVEGANVDISINDDENTITISAANPGEGNPGLLQLNAGKGLSVQDGEGPTATISITNNSISDDELEDNSLTSLSIANDAIGTSEIQDNAVTVDKIVPDILSSINNVTNDGGNIQIVQGDNIAITTNDATKRITISAIAIRSLQEGNAMMITNEEGPVATVGVRNNAIDDDEIRDNSITGLSLAPNSVGASEIQTNAVGNSELQSNAVGQTNIQNNAVSQAKLAPNSVGSPELQDNSVGQSEIRTDAVSQLEIQTNAVGSAEIQVDAVTQSEIASNAVGNSELQDNAVGTNELQSNAVTLDKILPNIISSIDGVTNDGGNINLVAGANMTITPSDVNNSITFSAAGGGGGGTFGPEVYLEPNGFLGTLDASDRLMAGIGVNPDLGGGIVGISNSVGLQIAALAADNRGAFLEMRNDQGTTITEFRTSDFGGAVWELDNASNNLVVRISDDPQGNGEISVANASEQPVAFLTVDDQDGGMLDISNASDMTVALLSSNPNRGSQFIMGNEIGDQVINMGSNPGSLGYIDIFNNNGDRRATMTVNSDDHGEFLVTNSQNNIVSALTEIGDFGFVGVSRPNGFNIAAMTHVPFSDAGYIYTTNAEGIEVTQMATDGNNNGYVGVQSRDGGPIVAMHGTEQGHGYLNILSNTGGLLSEMAINTSMDGGLFRLLNSDESSIVQAESDFDNGVLSVFPKGQNLFSAEMRATEFGGQFQASNSVGLPVAFLGSEFGDGLLGLTNANNTLVIETGANDLGGGFLGVYNEDGNGVIKMESDQNGNGNIIVASNFEPQAAMEINALGEGIVTAYNSLGQRASVLTQIEDYGFIGVSRPNGINIAAMTRVPFSDEGFIYTTNTEGAIISQMASDGLGNGYIGVQNSLQAPIVSMYGNENGDGYLDLANNSGGLLVTLSKDSEQAGGNVSVYNESNASQIALLGTNFQNQGRLQINNDVGEQRAIVTALTNGGYIAVDNSSGEDVARIGVNTSGAGIVVVDNVNGNRAVQLNSSSSGHGYIGVDNNASELIVKISSDSEGNGDIDVHNNSGTEVSTLSTSSGGGGYIGVNNPQGKNVAKMTITSTNNGYVGVYNSNESETVKITGNSDGGEIDIRNDAGTQLSTMTYASNGGGYVGVSNTQGTDVARMTMANNGNGYFGINTSNGEELIQLTSSSNRGSLSTKDSGGDNLVRITSTTAGDGWLEINNSSGNLRARMTTNTNGGGFLGINNGSGNERAQGTTLGNGAGAFFTYGNNGVINCSVSTSFSNYPNHGCVRVYNSFGDDRAGMCINEQGEGQSWADVKHFKVQDEDDPTKEIWYASLEGPEAGAYLRGTARLTKGEVTIPLPDHFSQVAIAEGMTVQLTPLSAESEGLAVVKKTTNKIVVKELRRGQGNYEFDYIIHAIRKGYENYKVIRPKKEELTKSFDNGGSVKSIGLDESGGSFNADQELVIPGKAVIHNR